MLVVLNTINPVAGFEIAFRCATVMRGSNNPFALLLHPAVLMH